jgi:hypothetical protein
MPITLGDKKLGSVASPVTGLHLESSTTENDRALRLAYDGTFYSEMRNAGAAGIVFRNNSTTDLVTIDGSGRIIRPFHPAFSARINNAGGTAGPGVIVFNATSLNTGSHYSTTNGRFTAPIAGRYVFIMHGSSQQGTSDFVLQINGSDSLFQGYSSVASSSVTASANAIFDLSANDYVTVRSISTYRGDSHTFWLGYLLG